MNVNEECFYLRRKLVKSPLVGKDTKEVQYTYICIHKKNYMAEKGCPPPKDCKGFTPGRYRTMIAEDI